MHSNFEDLQKRCKKYKLKKRAIIILPVVTVISVVTLYLSVEDKAKKIDTSDLKKTTHIIKKVHTEKKSAKKDLEYSLKVDTTYVPKEKIRATYENYVAPVKKVVPIEKPKPIKKIRDKEPTNKNVEEFYVDKRDMKPLSISVTKLQSTDQMISLYNKEKNYDLALKIATHYYDSKKYSKALQWAKKANILDRKDAGAWIIYAKSEYAKRNFKRAIKILKLYLTNANSAEAKALLETWKEQH